MSEALTANRQKEGHGDMNLQGSRTSREEKGHRKLFAASERHSMWRAQAAEPAPSPLRLQPQPPDLQPSQGLALHNWQLPRPARGSTVRLSGRSAELTARETRQL